MQAITEQRLIDAFHAQLGPAIRDALDCPTVVEVMVNDCGRVRLDTIDKGRIETAYVMPPGSAEAIIRLVANHIGEAVSDDHPLIAGTIPLTGERFQGVLPPLTHAPNFTIRKRPNAIFRLDDYVERGIVSQSHADMLRHAVAERKNIIVSGGTSSGKTTLLNALLAERSLTEDRVVLIEDTRELQCSARDQVQLLTKRTEPKITMRDLVQTTLRMRPDRIVVGEIRDGAGALEMLKAWNTGHDGGLGTLHANYGNGCSLPSRGSSQRGCRQRALPLDRHRGRPGRSNSPHARRPADRRDRDHPRLRRRSLPDPRSYPQG